MDRAVQVCQEIRGGVLQLKDQATKELEEQKLVFSDRWHHDGYVFACDQILQLIDSVTPDPTT